jgi:hypothetical protein
MNVFSIENASSLLKASKKLVAHREDRFLGRSRGVAFTFSRDNMQKDPFWSVNNIGKGPYPVWSGPYGVKVSEITRSLAIVFAPNILS